MKVAIIYDSRTGNTEAAAGQLAQVYRDRGHEVVVTSVDKADPAEAAAHGRARRRPDVARAPKECPRPRGGVRRDGGVGAEEGTSAPGSRVPERSAARGQTGEADAWGARIAGVLGASVVDLATACGYCS